MADITVAEFRTRFPEFVAESDDDVGQFIQTAYILSDVSREATLNLAAHLGTLFVEEPTRTIDDRGGTIIEESFGPREAEILAAGDGQPRGVLHWYHLRAAGAGP